MAPYYSNGRETEFFCEAEHDIIYFHITADDIARSSDDGKKLIELGFHLDSDIGVWAKYT